MTTSPRKHKSKEPTDAELEAAARTWVMDGMPGPEEWTRMPRPSREAMNLLGMRPERVFTGGEPTSNPPISPTFGRFIRNASMTAAVFLFWGALQLMLTDNAPALRAVLCASVFALLGILVAWAHDRDEAEMITRRERARPWIEAAVADDPVAAARWSQLSEKQLPKLETDGMPDDEVPSDDPMREAHRIAQAEQRDRHKQEAIELARQITLAQDRLDKLEQWVEDWHAGPRAWEEQYSHPFFDDDASPEAAAARSARRAASRALAELQGPSPQVTPTQNRIRQLLDLVDEAEQATQRAWDTTG